MALIRPDEWRIEINTLNILIEENINIADHSFELGNYTW